MNDQRVLTGGKRIGISSALFTLFSVFSGVLYRSLRGSLHGSLPGTPQRRTPIARRVANLLLMTCAAGMLNACALPSFMSFKGDKVKWTQLTLSASDDVNNNSPVAIDVVLVTDDTLLPKLTELPASKWFAARADLVNTYPGGLRYLSWEVVPGQQLVVPGEAFEGPRVAGVYVFANYPAPGAHRVRLEQFDGRLVVRLDNNTFSVSAVK